MTVFHRLGLLLFLAMLTLTGCKPGAPASKEKIYDIKGKVVALEPENKKVKIDHEAIPGFMDAMTMRFPVEDAKLLNGLQVGDAVQGRLKVMPEGHYYLTELKKR